MLKVGGESFVPKGEVRTNKPLPWEQDNVMFIVVSTFGEDARLKLCGATPFIFTPELLELPEVAVIPEKPVPVNVN